MMTPKNPLSFFGTLLLLFAVVGCSESVDPRAVPVLPQLRVEVETLSLKPVPFQIEVVGTLQAAEKALVRARISGQVVEMPVDVGSRVRRGDLLLRLGGDELSARVRQAETQLSQDRRNLERETRLQQVNASTRERVQSLTELVQISDAAYREAQAVLDYTRILAPFTATVTQRMIEVGDQATHGSALFQLENPGSLEVLVQVPEALALGLELGSTLSLVVPAAGIAAEARIREISPTVDPLTRSTQAKLTLAAQPTLRSGQFVRVALPDNRAQTLMIPASSLQHKGQMEQVFVAEQGVARLRLVRSGARFADGVEILSGLRAGERVVVRAEGRLLDGQPLEIVEAGSLP